MQKLCGNCDLITLRRTLQHSHAWQVGTGNIVGACSAILIGGPVYYIKHAFNVKLGKFLAGFFAVAIIIACGFVGLVVSLTKFKSKDLPDLK